MKKILGAVLAGTLVAGMAFADPAITLNSRVRMDAYKQTKTEASTTTSIWDQTGYDASKDCFVVDISTDYAGAHMDIDLWNKVTQGAKHDADPTTNQQDFGFQSDSYYGWMKFFDVLTVTAGQFDQRNVDRVNWASTDINLTDSDEAKLGVWNEVNGTKAATIGYDAGDFGNGELNTAVQFDKDALMIRGALVQASSVYKTPDSGDTDKTTTYSGYQLEGAYNIDGIGKLDIMFKAPANKQTVFGVYFMPTAVANLTGTVGFTYANQGDEDFGKYTAYAIDARVGYKVSDAVKVALQANFSSSKLDGYDDANTAMYAVGGVSYVASDLITLKCDAGVYYTDLDDSDKTGPGAVKGDFGENYFKLAPSVKFSAGAGAAVTTGLVYYSALNTGDLASNSTITKTQFEIPLIVRVKM